MSGLARFSFFLFPLSLLIWHQSEIVLSQENGANADWEISQNSQASTINRPTLKSGSRGEAVSELQATLKLLGYYNGVVNGIYRESTAIAVSRFQKAAGLSPDGIVDRATWERLFPQNPLPPSSNSMSRSIALPASNFTSKNEPASENSNATDSERPVGDLPTLKLGMRGPEVFWLQKRLQATGFFEGKADGIFGADTLEAVKAAQEKYGLKADGIVGSSTWKALLP